MPATNGHVTTLASTTIEPPLSEAAAEAWIPRTCFKNGPPSRIGVELEMLVVDARLPNGLAIHYPRHRYPPLLRALADGGLDGSLTVEPGGQVELSSRPGPDLAHTIAVVHRDLSALRRRAAGCGTHLLGHGVDPVRSPRRIADDPRYTAMERYFRPWAPAGQAMMCSTASVQVNVEAEVRRLRPSPIEQPAGRRAYGHHPSAWAAAPAGPVLDVTARWDLLHAIGPALVAAFANSPRRCGRPTGWKSTRQGVWLDLDPARTGVLPRRPGEGVESAWTRWALDAPMMLVRRDGGSWAAPPGLSFRSWLRLGRAAVPDRPPPTLDDLAYHLTTLFPQVRPRGHLEIRFIDAQPGTWWTVPPAVISALLDDAVAADRARDACAPVEGRWRDAAWAGVRDTRLAAAAVRVLEIAASALAGNPGTAPYASHVEGYLQRWTAAGRCPADDPPDVATGPSPSVERGRTDHEGVTPS